MQHDAGAAAWRVGCLCLRDGKRALAVRGPNVRRVGAGAAREDLDALGHHEGRIEADAKAADQRRLLVVFGRFQPIDERLGAGARDGAERFDQLLAAHADAVVLDHELPLFGIDRDRDAWRRIVAKERGLRDRLVAQPLAGVGRIRDQFAQKTPTSRNRPSAPSVAKAWRHPLRMGGFPIGSPRQRSWQHPGFLRAQVLLRSNISVEHDLIGKPVSTFPDISNGEFVQRVRLEPSAEMASLRRSQSRDP